MKRLAVGPIATSEYIEWWGRRINDNISGPSQGDSQPTQKHPQVVPSELEIIIQNFKIRNAELEKKIEQMKEEKINLRLDMDVQKQETEKLRKWKNKAEGDLDKEKIKADRWERKFQKARMLNETLEKSLLESRNKKGELKARVAELEKILYQYQNRNSVIELRIREVADYLQTLAVQADILSVKYELESDRGQELASLLRKIKALSVRDKPYIAKTKDMDQRLEKIEQQ
ncbi:hypothetical protein Gotur_018799 [Gossypium turneri]